MVLRRKGDKLVVNLVNRGAGEMLMPRRVINEELLPIEDVKLTVRLDRVPTSVTAVPDADLEWDYADGILRVTVPSIAIHTAVVIE